jgi:uncharacterized linocin/CFP29 family protein
MTNFGHFPRLSRVGLETGQLTDEEIRYIDTAVIDTVKPTLIGRRLFGLERLPDAGYRTWRKYAESDMGQATIDMEGITNVLDHVEYTNKDVSVPVLSKGFKLFWRDIIASRRGGIPIDTRNVANAARQVAEEEDKLLISGEYTGWRALGIQGLSTATGRATQATAGVWTTIVNIYTDVSAAIAALEANGHYGPYAMILRSSLKARLRQINTNTSDTVETVLKQLLDNIYVSDSLFPSTGTITPTQSVLVVEQKPGNFALGIGQDAITWTTQDLDMNTVGKVYEVLTPRIDHATAICELTGVA